MKLRFGKAHHGWLPTTLELDGGETLPFDLSYLPYDFIGELVAALASVLDGPGEYAARMCEEPTEHEWRFRAFDTSAVTFEVVTWFDGRGRKGEIVARAWGSPIEIVLPMWRALRELAGRAQAEGWRSHWRTPFPFDALDKLTVRVEQARAGSLGNPLPPAATHPMTNERSEAGLAGQVMTHLTPARLAPALRRAGLDATLRKSRSEGASVRLDGVGDADCSIQPCEPGEYLVCDAGGERGALEALATALSAALAGMGIRHRLELYDDTHQMFAYLHLDWPLS